MKWCRVITQPADVKAFFADSQLHVKARASNAGWFFEQVLGQCLGQINGEAWTALHRRLEPAFGREAARTRFASTATSAKTFLRELAGEEGSVQVRRVKIADTFKAFPFLHTASIIYGSMTVEEKGRLWQLAEHRTSLLSPIIKGGIYRSRFSKYIDHKSYRNLKSFKNSWLCFNREMFEKGREKPSLALIQQLWPVATSNSVAMDQVRPRLIFSRS